MRFVVFFVLLSALFSGLVSAHAEDSSEVQSCAAPVLSEATIPLWQFGALAALFVAGALVVGLGLSLKKPVALAGVSLRGLHVAVVGAVLVLAAAGVYASGPGFNFKTGFFEKDQHVHADIKVFIQGQAVNFSEARFQSTAEHALTEYIHFHDGRSNVVHLHASGVPLSYLFGTFGGVLNASCIQVASDEPMHCADGSGVLKVGPNQLKFYVNGQLQADAGSYVLKDLDRLLISFGPSGQDVSSQLASVTEEACIFSGKCPVPPGYDLHPESCAS